MAVVFRATFVTMLRVVIIVSALLCCYGAASTGLVPSGKAITQQPSINASIADFPYTANLLIYGGFHRCGAAIISEKFALTSAGCVEGLYWHDVTLSVGGVKYMFDGIELKVAALIPHEEFDRYAAKNDIALVKIEDEFPFGDLVQSIPLAFNTPPEGTTVTTTSWKSSLDYKVLQTYNNTVIDEDTCISYYTKYYNLTKVFCAGIVRNDMNTCIDEEGSPLVANGELVGIISNVAMGCTTWDRPRVRIDVASYRPWIAVNAGV